MLQELRLQGYTGGRTQLELLLLKWRRNGASQAFVSGAAVPRITASVLCMAPRPKLTERQASRVDLLKEQLPGFAAMRQLAMRFRGILRGDTWLADVGHSGLHALRRFGQVLSRDIDAVRNAIREDWSNGQTEGQINKLKALKRAM